MGLIYKTDKRTTIPRWRSHDLALEVGELSPLQMGASSVSLDFRHGALIEQIFAWNKYRTIPHAADLFSSAYAMGIENDFLDIATFLYKEKDNISKVLLRQVTEVLGISKDELLLDVNFDFFTEEGKKRTISEISRIRHYLKKEPNNPLAWVDLARNHSLLGNIDKSIMAIETALHVNDTSDRFVLRSASRLFHHLGDDERAHSIIRKGQNIKFDPWLISSEIAYSSILNRRSGLIKNAKEIIKGKKFSPFQISELASAVGTTEFFEGDFKNAKSMFNTALIQPNDNSLAQVIWFHEYFPYLLELSAEQINIPLAFEAQTHLYYNSGDYKSACKSAIRWLNDEPYSTRPVRLASYISTIFLGNNSQSIEILKHGLKANRTDLKLLNSLCYNLLLEDDISEAEKYLGKYKNSVITSEPVETKIAIVATTGLYNFRIGNIDEGRKSYLESIEFAIKQKSDYLQALAVANYLREEIIVYKKGNIKRDKLIIISLVDKLKGLTIKARQSDVLRLSTNVLREYDAIDR